jgi:hypothetical protein
VSSPFVAQPAPSATSLNSQPSTLNSLPNLFPCLVITAFAAVALGIGLAFACGGVSFGPAVGALIGGALAGGFAFWQMPRPVASRRVHPVEWALLAVFACASLRAFLWLLYVKDNELHILSPNNLGDLPLHLDFIRYLASGVPFWPESPILAGGPLEYPIGADFFNSLLLAAGLPVERGLVWVGLAGAAATAAALWRWGRGFALAAFLFGGGLAGFAWIQIAFSGRVYLPDYQAAATWKNLFLALFVTQRGLLLALPAGLFLLAHWRDRILRGGRGFLPGWAALLLYATMPLHNVHAFLALSILLGGMFVFACDRAARRRALVFVGCALVPATLCAWLVTGGFSAGGGVHLQFGWMQHAEKDVSPAWFWLRNFGLYLVLWAALIVVAIFRRDRETLGLVLPATLLFAACCVVSFAVWPWDNTKILLWAWLAVAPGIWATFLQPLYGWARAVLCVVLFFTGALSLVAGLDSRHDYKIVDLDLVENAAGAVRGLDANARFACAPEYWHPLIVLGRKVAVGYDGHLWSHGLKYADQMRDLDALMDAEEGEWEQAARRLRVDYLYWGTPEEERWPGSDKTWSTRCPVAAQGEDFTIYDLRSLRR